MEMSTPNVLIVSDKEINLNIFLNKMFNKVGDFNGENCLEIDVDLKAKYYNHKIHLFLDKTPSSELSQWLDELLDDDMLELRESLQGIVILIEELTEISTLIPKLTQLAYKLDDEFYKEGVYQWDGLKSIVLFQSNDKKFSEIDDETYETFDKSTFTLIPLNPEGLFDELLELFQTTEWRGVEIDESVIKNTKLNLKNASVRSKPPLNPHDDVDILALVDKIKEAKLKADGNTEKANEFAEQIAEQIYKT